MQYRGKEHLDSSVTHTGWTRIVATAAPVKYAVLKIVQERHNPVQIFK
jgi:hypothetical protein